MAFSSPVRAVLTAVFAISGCVHAEHVRVPPTAASAAPSVSTTPKSTPHFASPYTYEWFIRAELLRSSGQLAAAIQAYRTALAGSDEDAHVLARLGSALDEQGAHEQAAELLDDALRLEPDSEVAWLARAELAQRRGAFEPALEALERAEQAAPLSPRAPLALAALLRARGNPERADAVLLRYEARSLPGTHGAQAAQLSRALASHDTEQIFAATLPYRLFAPSNPSALSAAAKQLLDQGRAALALRVIDLVPETANESPLRLRVFLACGRWAAAEAWLADHEASDRPELLELARAQLLLRHPEAAAQLLESERLAGADEPSLQLVAAEIDLARSSYANAALRFARIPRGSSAYPEARLGLVQALSAEALPDLAAEVSAQRAVGTALR
jgi:Tfp pilus assembly protein PilF